MNFFSKYDQIRRPNLWETINMNQKTNYDELVTVLNLNVCTEAIKN